MAVVINEVDVVPAEQKQEPAVEQEKSAPSEHDIQRLVEQQASRCERVWAY